MSDARPQHLSPSLREKRRYIAFKIHCAKTLQELEVNGAIYQSVLNLLGELGMAESSVFILRGIYTPDKKIGLIRCSHTAVEHVRAALALASRVGEEPIMIEVLGISGTIKAARRKYLGERILTSF